MNMELFKKFNFKKDAPFGFDKLVRDRKAYIGCVHARWSSTGWKSCFVPGAPVIEGEISDLLGAVGMDIDEELGNDILSISKVLFGNSSSFDDIQNMCSEYFAYEGTDGYYMSYSAYVSIGECCYRISYRLRMDNNIADECLAVVTILKKESLPTTIPGKEFFNTIISNMEIPEFIDYHLPDGEADSNLEFAWHPEEGCFVNLRDNESVMLIADLDYGTSEGIYLYIYVVSGGGYLINLGVIKTLEDTPEAMRDMGMLWGDFMLSYHKLARVMGQD